MFPSAKRRKMSSGQPPRKDRDARPPRRNGPGGKGWKQSRDGEKPFGKKPRPGGKTFGAKKAGDREKKFGGKKRFEGNKTFGGNKNKDKSFRSKGQKAKPGFKKRGAGAKQGFKQRKGKGWTLHSSFWTWTLNVLSCWAPGGSKTPFAIDERETHYCWKSAEGQRRTKVLYFSHCLN